MAATEPDAVDDLIAQWAHERPDLDDLDAMATFGRLARFSARATRAIEAVFAQHDLNVGEFDVLAALRRRGDPYEMTPGELSRTLMLSPAGMTNRLDRLEAAGHVQRRSDPGDRRSWIVALTPSGRDLVDRAVTDHVANEARLLAPLTRRDRQALDRALRVLLANSDA